MVCASEPLNALAQPRRALARRWRSAVPCFGISGVAAFNLSRRINQGDTVLIDFFPDFSKDELLDTLEQRVNVLGDFSPRNSHWLDGMLAPQLSHVVCTAFERCHPGSRDVIHLVSILKHFKLSVEGTAEERSAQVTRGGISIECVSTPNLYVNSTTAPRFTSAEKRSTSTPIAEALTLRGPGSRVFALQAACSRAVYNQKRIRAVWDTGRPLSCL
mgnify:CR=1 FL=1